ncbi:MAG: hypothetical protein LBP75_05585 [Planctomycetota bacterium]|nr:hypothetical protein [Planctomycetota bacterium]
MEGWHRDSGIVAMTGWLFALPQIPQHDLYNQQPPRQSGKPRRTATPP